MRTRLLTSLTGYEVDEYVKRNDVIFVPVGPTELNGGNPTDVEYVIPSLMHQARREIRCLVFPTWRILSGQHNDQSWDGDGYPERS